MIIRLICCSHGNVGRGRIELFKMPREGGTISANNCRLCHRSSRHTGTAIGICGDCMRETPAEARLRIESVHAASRAEYALPSKPFIDPNGICCALCSNECCISGNQRGFLDCAHRGRAGWSISPGRRREVYNKTPEEIRPIYLKLTTPILFGKPQAQSDNAPIEFIAFSCPNCSGSDA
jgi:hypothetical protein